MKPEYAFERLMNIAENRFLSLFASSSDIKVFGMDVDCFSCWREETNEFQNVAPSS